MWASISRLSSGVDSQAATRTSTRGSQSAKGQPAADREASGDGFRRQKRTTNWFEQHFYACLPSPCLSCSSSAIHSAPATAGSPGTPSTPRPSSFVSAASWQRRSQVAFSTAADPNSGASSAMRSGLGGRGMQGRAGQGRDDKGKHGCQQHAH